MGKQNTVPIMHTNKAFTHFIEQDFPVKTTQSGSKAVECVSFLGTEKHKHLLCTSFYVEVSKTYEGDVFYITVGRGWNDDSFIPEIIDIMHTTDFNKAYELKNKLKMLCGREPSKYEKMHCYGTLQREQLPLDI